MAIVGSIQPVDLSMVSLTFISAFYWVMEQVATSPKCRAGKKKWFTEQRIAFARDGDGDRRRPDTLTNQSREAPELLRSS